MNTTHAPETLIVERRMYLVPRDATIPGGMAYRHSGGLRSPNEEFVADGCGLSPDGRARDIDYYTYEKLEPPEPGLTIQSGLVLGNVRFPHESPDETRHIVMFLDGGKVAVVYPDGEASVSLCMFWNDYDPSQNDMIFDVIFDPEHDTVTYSIGYEEKAPVTPNYAITLDAASVKAEVQDRFDHSGDPDLTQGDVDTVLAASDERISQLINNFVDDSFWSEYDDVRSRVISQLLAEAP